MIILLKIYIHKNLHMCMVENQTGFIACRWFQEQMSFSKVCFEEGINFTYPYDLRSV